MSDFIFNKPLSEIPKSINNFLAFGYHKSGDGKTFTATVCVDGETIELIIPHQSLDAYIYGLQELKQQLELIRIKND